MPKCNLDIRDAVKSSGFTLWMVADRLGITDATFSRWLRKELPDSKKQEVFKAVEELKQEFSEAK